MQSGRTGAASAVTATAMTTADGVAIAETALEPALPPWLCGRTKSDAG